MQGRVQTHRLCAHAPALTLVKLTLSSASVYKWEEMGNTGPSAKGLWNWRFLLQVLCSYQGHFLLPNTLDRDFIIQVSQSPREDRLAQQASAMSSNKHVCDMCVGDMHICECTCMCMHGWCLCGTHMCVFPLGRGSIVFSIFLKWYMTL